MITQAELLELFDYNKETGRLIWKSGKKTGKEAGYTRKDKGNEYRYIKIKNKKYQEHRIIWVYHHKEFTKPFINHINCNPSDNRIENLEVVTPRENNQRMKIHLNGKLPGARFLKKYGIWVAEIQIGNKQIRKGCYRTEGEAHERYLQLVEALKD